MFPPNMGRSNIPITTDAPSEPPYFANLSHAAASTFLQNAHKTGKLGPGPCEPDYLSHHVIKAVLHTIPWDLLLVQLVWSSCIVALAYSLADQPASNSLSAAFWKSRLNVPSSVSSGVGWALFVLLGFFIREASKRYRDAQVMLSKSGSHLCQIARAIRQAYPPGLWHHGDLERIGAHLVAAPIALKMVLRGERDREQLKHILHPDDVTDLINTAPMYLHCTRVVRAYLFTSEPDDPAARFPFVAARKSPAGLGVRHLLFELIDSVELQLNTTLGISEFRPSVAYVNHLQIFLYIWMMFLPLALLESSGWYVSRPLTRIVHVLHHYLCALCSHFRNVFISLVLANAVRL